MGLKAVYKAIFFLGVTFIPLIFLPEAYIAYEVPKVWFVERWIEILGILTLILIPKIAKKERVDNQLIFTIVAFLVFSFISSIIGADPLKSVFGNYYRKDGLLTLIHLAILFFSISILFHKKWVLFFSEAVSLGTLASSIWAVYCGASYYFFGKTILTDWGGPIAISFGNPNFLAGYLLVTLPLVTIAIKNNKGKSKIVWKLTVVLQSVAILLTRSWAGVLGLVLFFAGWMVIAKRGNKVGIALTAATIILTLLIFYQKPVRIQQTSNIIVAESRERIFTKALLSFKKKPWTGWGWANFDIAFVSVEWPLKMYDDVYVDKAHSLILEVLVTTGLPGVILYLFILYRVIKNTLKYDRKYSKYLTLSIILFILHSQTNIISISEEVLFWTIAGITSKQSQD